MTEPEILETCTVKELEQKEYLTWIDLSQDVEVIQDRIDGAEEYDSFFIDTTDGDYSEVWGMYNTVPYLGKTVYRLV